MACGQAQDRHAEGRACRQAVRGFDRWRNQTETEVRGAIDQLKELDEQ
jgi:hypothetical protein